MNLLCLVGKHAMVRRRDADRVTAMGRSAPDYLVCTRCGHEQEMVVLKDRQDPPFVGG